MRRSTWTLCGLTAAAAIALGTLGSSAAEPTSQTDAHLKKWLEKFPAADANHDGILTATEVWDYQLNGKRRALENAAKAKQAAAAKAKPAGQTAPASAAKPAATAKPVAKAKPAAQPAQPKPDFADVKYGPHERNVLDLWLAKSDKPTPLVVHIHGGGWMHGDKQQISGQVLGDCLSAGVSVASINYRYTTTAPLPAPHQDSARAIQFLRSKAQPWNLDPTRVAAYGGSAGAGISLWLAFHDDMADPHSSDPVARQSTRLCAAATFGGQTSYDPHVIKQWIGGQAYLHDVFLPAYAAKTHEELDDPKFQKIFDEVSAIKHLTADDPPVFMIYSEPNAPLPPDAPPTLGMHSPIFGLKLKAAMDPLKIECVYFHTVESDDNPNTEMVKFFLRHFGLK